MSSRENRPAPLDHRAIQQRVEELGPWIQPLRFNGVEYLDRESRPPDLPGDGLVRESRVCAFYDVFPDAVTILELGACEGADTLYLAARDGAQVTAVEGRQDNCERAKFVLGLHGLTNVRWVVADVETMDLAQWGRFDAVVCAGLLYHLERPWALLRSISAITANLLIWTHYWGDETTAVWHEGYLVKEVVESYPDPRLNSLRSASWWFCWSSLVQALADCGFSTVQRLDERGSGPVRDATLVAGR